DLILQFPDSDVPYTEVSLKRAEAAMAEWIITDHYTREMEGLYNLPGKFEFGFYAAALRPEDDTLAEELNRHIEEMKRNGELGTIYKRYKIWSPMQERLGIAPGQEGSREEEDESNVWLLLIRASGMTLFLTLVAMPLALAFGLGLALMGRSRNP